MFLKNLYLKILFILLTNSCFAQLIPQGWIEQSSNVNTTLKSVYFLNSLTGWSAGNNGVILSTSNGGTNWEHQTSSVTNNLEKVFFSSPEIGYVIGGSGIILKTTNGGSNWFQQNSGTFNDLTSSSFVNNSIGFVCGLNNTLLKTTNGGTNWNSISFQDSVSYYSIYFINNSTGWLSSVKTFATVPDSAFIMKTTDGGDSWFAQHSRWNDAVPNLSLQFTDSMHGWCTWQIPTLSATHILKTTDGGSKWISYGGFNGDHYYLNFVNNMKGWSSGAHNSIYRTDNGGVNWIRTPAIATTSFFFKSILFSDSLIGWTVGSDGRILKTTNGGILTGFSNASSEIPEEYFLSQNYPNPFNPTSNLGFGISDLGFVSLKIYDVLGNEVATLVNENKPAGSYEVEFNGSNHASGIYFYRLEVDGKIVDAKRMLLLK